MSSREMPKAALEAMAISTIRSRCSEGVMECPNLWGGWPAGTKSTWSRLAWNRASSAMTRWPQ